MALGSRAASLNSTSYDCLMDEGIRIITCEISKTKEANIIIKREGCVVDVRHDTEGGGSMFNI
jgi:hypothetical protein